MMEEFSEDKIYFEEDGRAFKKISSTHYEPLYTFVYGKFTGKFHSDKVKSESEKAVFYDFKIYEGEVEILYKSKSQKKLSPNEENAVSINASQLPAKIFFFETIGDKKVYYNLNLKNPVFHNFKFVEYLQQNEDEEAFGTVEGEIYGYLLQLIPHRAYKKLYKKIRLVPCKTSVLISGKTAKDDRKEADNDTSASNGSIPNVIKVNQKTGDKLFSSCFRNLLLAFGLTIFSLVIGFVPTFLVGLIWLLYTIFTCYFRWFRYLLYFFSLVFLVSLVYVILNINWDVSKQPFVPHVDKKGKTRIELVKLIKLVDSKGNKEDLLITRKMNWTGYHGEKYSGEYAIKKSYLDESRAFKNSIPYTISYSEVLNQLSVHDYSKLGGLYTMFDEIKKNQPIDDKRFAEMIVSFVQQIPYYLVLDKSCNIDDYVDPSIQKILQDNPGRCTPNQKFGITTPVEFMANLQGDCDSRTVLLYTILKHYKYDVAIFSSDIYKHSILGINLPYSGIKYPFAGRQYTLWETTSVYKPGEIPSQITNLNYWYLSLN